jgi:hypothetical protein
MHKLKVKDIMVKFIVVLSLCNSHLPLVEVGMLELQAIGQMATF